MFFEIFGECVYIMHIKFKIQKIWQQQLKLVPKTTSTKSRSTSTTKESSLPHHSTLGAMP